MDELIEIIEKFTKGNYLMGRAAKEEMAKEIMELFSRGRILNKRLHMKNLPKKIYLQIGGCDVTIDESTNWDDLCHEEITWSTSQINKNDIVYVLPGHRRK